MKVEVINSDVKFNDIIKQLIKKLEVVDHYELMSYFYFEYKKGFHFDQNRDCLCLNRKKILYLQILFKCVKSDETNKIKLTEKKIVEIDKMLSKINELILRKKIENLDDNYTEEEKDYLIHSDSFGEFSGKRYDIFEVQHHKDLLSIVSEEFENTFDFSIEELYAGISSLKNNFYFVYEKNFDEIRSLINDGKIEIEENGNVKFAKSISKKEKTRINQFFKNVFKLELIDILNATNWNNKFIETFILEETEIDVFLKNVSINSWNSLVNKLKYKPIMSIGDKYYLCLEQFFYDNFDRSVMREICNHHSKEKDIIRKKYTSNIENLIVNYLNKILNSKNAYINNFYDYNGKTMENDILIEFDNNIFIIEVKSGNFTPELARDDLTSHKKSLDHLIAHANIQQNNLESLLELKKEVIIFDSNNKKKRKEKFRLKLSEETKIIKIIITAESFNDIEARADKVKILSMSKDTIVICLDDLRVYSHYFSDHPCYFLQYLFQRKKTIGNKNIDLCDELYHLGLWLDYNFYNEHTNNMLDSFIAENNINKPLDMVTIIGEDWMEELNKYYNNLYFNKSEINKPFRIMPEELTKIISYLEKNNISKKTYFSTFLLDLDKQTMDIVEKMVKNSREYYRMYKRPKFGFVSLKNTYENDIDGLNITSIYDDDQFDKSDLYINAYADMYLSKTNKVLMIFIYYNKDKKIKMIDINILSATDELAGSKEVLEFSEKLKKKREIKIRNKKVGRNELCPCGSGKKYKKCCIDH